MALKTSNGEVAKKRKVNITEQLLQDEIAKMEDTNRKDSFRIANQNVSKDVADIQVSKLPIASLYAAPYSDEWNDFKKLSSDKAYELNQSIVDGGLLTPIIVWKVNKNSINEVYENNNDPYGFVGHEYMILAGHSRTYAFVELYNATGDDRYTKIDAVVRENLTYEQAKYIIKVTNFVNRELSPAEKRRNINYLHRNLSNEETSGTKIAKKIASDSGSKLRTVQYYMSINENLIDEFAEWFDNERITLGSAIKLVRLTNDMQRWMYEEYGDSINDKILKGLQPSYDKKEQISNLFDRSSELEYMLVSIEIPKCLEKKFRTMASKWISKNI